MEKLRPKMYYHSIFDINYNLLKEKGIKVLIFDLVNTIMTYNETVPSERVISKIR